jgi:hypothetical protein
MAISNLPIPITTPTAITLPTVTSPSIGNAVTAIIICNYTPSTSAQVTVYVGASATNTTMIISALPVPPGETVSLDQEKLVLGSSDNLYFVSSVASTLSVTVSTLPV